MQTSLSSLLCILWFVACFGGACSVWAAGDAAPVRMQVEYESLNGKLIEMSFQNVTARAIPVNIENETSGFSISIYQEGQPVILLPNAKSLANSMGSSTRPIEVDERLSCAISLESLNLPEGSYTLDCNWSQHGGTSHTTLGVLGLKMTISSTEGMVIEACPQTRYFEQLDFTPIVVNASPPPANHFHSADASLDSTDEQKVSADDVSKKLGPALSPAITSTHWVLMFLLAIVLMILWLLWKRLGSTR